jgi:hypothetical protein
MSALPWYARAWRFPQCIWLRWKIHSSEEWVSECAANGIFDTVAVRIARADLDVMRLELAILERTQP